MQTEKKQDQAVANEAAETADEQQEKTLSWLLEQDMSEPSEKLFSVSQEADDFAELTEAEAAMAARPLIRGSNDDAVLNAIVEEEIVVSSVGESSDIYRNESRPAEREQAQAQLMYVDHRSKRPEPAASTPRMHSGSDILGLREQDDIGERFLVIKKVPSAKPVELTQPDPVPEPAVVDSVIASPAEEPVIPAPAAIEAEDESGSLLAQADDVLDLVLEEDEAALDSLLDEEAVAELADDDRIEEELVSLEADERDTAIEFHQDFAQPLARASSIVAAVTPLLGELMDDLQQRVAAVLQQFELPADTLALDCSLATDEVSSTELLAQGYVSLTELSPQLPQCLQRLGQHEIDAIALRVLATPADPGWSRVLQDDFIPPIAVAESEPEALADLPAIDFYSMNPANDGAADGEQLAAEDIGPDTDAIFSPVEQRLLNTPADCDAGLMSANDELGSFLGDVDEDPLESEAAMQPASMELAADKVALESGGDDFLFDDSDWDLGSVPATEEIDIAEELAASPMDLGAPAQPEQQAFGEEQSQEHDSDPVAVLEAEDIFGEDIDDANFGQLSSNSETDVDAMLQSLGETDFAAELDMPSLVDHADSAAASVASPTPPVAAITVSNTSAPQSVIEPESEPEQAVPVEAASSPVGAVSCIPAGITFSYSSQSDAELFADFLDAFIEEGALELEKLEDAISEWEQDIDSDSAYAPVPRILHTLKGIAKGVGLQRYGTLIHNFETLLEQLPRPQAAAAGDYFRIVNAWLDAAVRGFESIQDSRADIASELPAGEPAAAPDTAAAAEPGQQVSEPVSQPIAAAPAEETEEVSRETTRARDKKLADEGAKALAAQQTIRLSAEAVDNLMNLTNQAQQLGVRSSQGTVRSKLALGELQGRLSSVRSHITRVADRALMNVTARGDRANSSLDALEMDQYSELQEAASILREGIEDLSELIQLTSRQNAMVEALLKQQNGAMSSLRSAIQAARVIPVSRLMPGLRRIVRTVGADLGKDVTFRVLNETGKLDRDNYNRCQVILEHMVRNALDHGIEDPDTRVALGKPRSGRISIDISKRGGDYVMRLTDDGRGMDPEVIRETAYRKGLDLDLEAMSEAEVLRLIFHKGFSTAARLSEVSGRGVGMDIVLSELQHIGGDIDIESTVGQGTTFSIRIPSNITANGALLVAAGEHSYAIPLDGLVAVEHVPVERFFTAIENDEVLDLFGMPCEPAYLATICHGESMPERKAWGATIPVIVAGRDSRCMAIAIDNVEQALELVIRTLGKQFARVPGLAGGATTADGRAIVALDLNALVESLAADGVRRVAMPEEKVEQMLVMVVDDSRTQRMVATSKFDTLGVETVTAENGMAALELLNASLRLPDVILLDVEMPVKDGIQTLKELRKTPRYAQIPVIMVTSRTGSKHRKLAAEAGCNGYMGKPFNFPLLVQDINKLTGRQLSLQ